MPDDRTRRGGRCAEQDTSGGPGVSPLGQDHSGAPAPLQPPAGPLRRITPSRRRRCPYVVWKKQSCPRSRISMKCGPFETLPVIAGGTGCRDAASGGDSVKYVIAPCGTNRRTRDRGRPDDAQPVLTNRARALSATEVAVYLAGGLQGWGSSRSPVRRAGVPQLALSHAVV